MLMFLLQKTSETFSGMFFQKNLHFCCYDYSLLFWKYVNKVLWKIWKQLTILEIPENSCQFWLIFTAYQRLISGVSFVAQQKWIWLESMRMWVRSLASTSGLRIQCCCELLCRLQMRLRSHCCSGCRQEGSCSSDLAPTLGTSICQVCTPKKKKKKKKQPKPEPTKINICQEFGESATGQNCDCSAWKETCL